MNLPPRVATAEFKIRPPLVHKSKLTSAEKNGVGKELSDGYALNFSIGCTFGCRFCYVAGMQRTYDHRAGDLPMANDWGYYFGIPSNMGEAIEQTRWKQWAGKEVMLSSTHDAFLPQLEGWTRKILEAALPAGVRFCIQTRSPLVERHFDLLKKYRDQVRVQVSIMTMNSALSRKAELRVVPPKRRAEIIALAKMYGLETGVIIAPVFPPVSLRPDVGADLEAIAEELADVGPKHIYGEALHARGVNVGLVEAALGEKVDYSPEFDRAAEKAFHEVLALHGLIGTWWPEF